MQVSEIEAQKYYEDLGYTVHRDGWPDFLVYKTVAGKLDMMGIEVKTLEGALRPAQAENHRLLSAFGLPVTIYWSGSEKERKSPPRKRRDHIETSAPKKKRKRRACRIKTFCWRCNKKKKHPWQHVCFDCWSDPDGKRK